MLGVYREGKESGLCDWQKARAAMLIGQAQDYQGTDTAKAL